MSDKPAFPFPYRADDPDINAGLTQRELFAAMAMQGFIANGPPSGIGEAIDVLVATSVAVADALCAELDKDNG